MPTSVRRDSATLAGQVQPGFVMTGTPAQSASLTVVCPLYDSVSRNRSMAATCLRCARLGFTTGRKWNWAVSTPLRSTSLRNLNSPTELDSNRHMTLSGT
eukprot:3612787-Rhodomonas_salina.1